MGFVLQRGEAVGTFPNCQLQAGEDALQLQSAHAVGHKDTALLLHDKITPSCIQRSGFSRQGQQLKSYSILGEGIPPILFALLKYFNKGRL